MAHTPGPWEIESDRPAIVCGSDRVICEIGRYKEIPQRGRSSLESAPKFELDEQGKANARLIAAAPDMLAALREVIRFVDSVGSEHINRVPFAAARAAIAKAEGEGK